MQHTTTFIELTGLLLIAVELYFPGAANRLAGALNRLARRSEPDNGVAGMILFVVLWILIAIIAALVDPQLGLIVNIAFSVAALLLGVLLALSRTLAWLGVALGRGNPVGGVGLIVALLGLSLEFIT